MANIDTYLEQIAKATYGEDVRQSIIDALSKVNDDNNNFENHKEEILKAYTLLLKSDTMINELAAESVAALSNLKELRGENFNSRDILTGVTELKASLGMLGDDVLGVEVDFENKTFTRLCGAVGLSHGSDFDAFNMFGGRKRCNLADDGTVNAYYGDEGYTEDGTNGQVMVEQPAFYYICVPIKIEKQTDGVGYHMRKARYYVCDSQYVGFKLHPAFYDEDGNQLEKIYFGAYEGCVWDSDKTGDGGDYLYNDEQVAQFATDKFSSIAGVKPASGLTQQLTRPNVETMCKNRGDGWHSLDIRIASMEQLLMLIEFGMMNVQSASGCNGVVSISDSSAYNCSSITGSTASLGNASGQAAGTYSDINGIRTLETTNGKTAYSYRGDENIWGNIWKFVYGVNIWGDGVMGGGQPYICTDYNYAESKNSDNYEAAGFTVTNANGYISAMGYSTAYDWLFIASECLGNSSLPVGDYTYVTANLNGYRIARLGGYWDRGACAGAFCWFLGTGVGSRDRTIGGRLVYIPKAKAA